MRLYVRLRIVRLPGLDDLFVFLYLVSRPLTGNALGSDLTVAHTDIYVAGISGVSRWYDRSQYPTWMVTRNSRGTFAGIKYGSGRHFLLLTFGEVKRYLILFYVLNISLNCAATFIKISQLFQFLRLFDKGTWAYRASVAGIVVVSLWGTAYTLLSIFPCSNIADSWNILAKDTRCWAYASQRPDEFTFTIVSHNIINTFFDAYIIAIPFRLYSKPGLSLRTRLGLMVLLLMGVTYVTVSTASRCYPCRSMLTFVTQGCHTIRLARIRDNLLQGWLVSHSRPYMVRAEEHSAHGARGQRGIYLCVRAHILARLESILGCHLCHS